MKRHTPQEKQTIISEYATGTPISVLSEKYQVPKSTLYLWAKEYKPNNTDGRYSIKELKELRRKVERQAEIIEILQTINCCVKSPLKEKLSELTKLYGKYNNHVLCEALKVDRGTFLNHIKRSKGDDIWYLKRREALCPKIKAIFEENNQIFGAKKNAAVLRQQGEIVSDKIVMSLMREMNLTSIRTNSKSEYIKDKRKQNILKQQFSAVSPNSVWTSDVTYFRFKDKFYNICTVIDLFSRKVISYSISKGNNTRLTLSALKKAISVRTMRDELIFHSDNGTNYTSKTFERCLAVNNIKHSFSRTQTPHDNAVSESFFSSMKREELYRRKISSEQQLFRIIEDYIEFYNKKRPHATLNYKTPDEFENEYYIK